MKQEQQPKQRETRLETAVGRSEDWHTRFGDQPSTILSETGDVSGRIAAERPCSLVALTSENHSDRRNRAPSLVTTVAELYSAPQSGFYKPKRVSSGWH